MKQLTAKIKTLTLLSALLLLPAFTVQAASDDGDHNFNVAKNIQVFNEIYNYLDLMYVDTLDADETVGTAINSMLRSLDPYTVYYPESEVNKLRTMMTGRYVGIEEQEDDGEPFDEKMERLTIELSALFAKSHDLENEIKKNLKAIGFEVE